MTKRRKLTAVCGALCLLCSAGGLSYLGIQDPRNLDSTPIVDDGDVAIGGESINSIRFVNNNVTKDANGNNIIKVKYELVPYDSDDHSFVPTIYWNNAAKDVENNTWDGSQTIKDYIDYSIDYTNRIITFTNYKPFGRQIYFSITSATDSSVNARMTIDYVRKLIKHPTFTTTYTSYTEGNPLSVDYTDATFSVGSKGSKATEEPEVSIEYRKSSTPAIQMSFDSLISTPTDFGTQKYGYFKYKYYKDGAEVLISEATSVRKIMVEKAETYLTSLASHKNSATKPVFEREKLKDILGYEYAAYYSYKQNWETNLSVYSKFITKYTEAYSKGNGFNLIAKYDGVEDFAQLLSLNEKSGSPSGLGFDDSAIEF